MQAAAEQQEHQAEEAVLILDSSQEDLSPDLREQEAALKAAFANLEKAKEEYRKAAALKAGKAAPPSQASLDSFFPSEPGKGSLEQPLPALKGVTPPVKARRMPYWLVAAKEEISEEGVREQALVKRALTEDQGQSKRKHRGVGEPEAGLP